MTMKIKSRGTGQWQAESLFEDGEQVKADVPTPQFRSASSQAPGAKLMSAENKALLRTMIAEREGQDGVQAVRDTLNRAREGGFLTTSIFKSCFDALKKIPRVPAVEAPAVAAPSFSSVDLWPGRFTLETEHGHRTFEIVIQASDAEFAPGEMVISYLSGRDNTADYTSFGFVKPGGRVVFWKSHRDNAGLKADVASFVRTWTAVAARDLPADEFIEALDDHGILAIRSCMRCGADLSVPESVRAGLGPECIKKGLR